MKKISIIFALLMLSSAALALPVDYKKYCSNQQDKSVVMICRTAFQFDVSVMKTGVSMTLASMEAAANHCDIKMKQSFYDGKNSAMRDPDIRKTYGFFFRVASIAPPANFKEYCNRVSREISKSVR